MANADLDVGFLAGAVEGLFDQRTTPKRRLAWRAWTPDGFVVLFESEYEQVARLLVVLLASQLNSRPILLESPDGAESYYVDGRWQAADYWYEPAVASASDRHGTRLGESTIVSSQQIPGRSLGHRDHWVLRIRHERAPRPHIPAHSAVRRTGRCRPLAMAPPHRAVTGQAQPHKRPGQPLPPGLLRMTWPGRQRSRVR